MTSTTQMILVISVMLAINVALMGVQDSMTAINPASDQFFNDSNSPYSSYVANDSLVVDDSYLPSDDDVEGDTSGNIFTDTYKSIKSWTQQKLAPLNFVGNIFKQPYGFLKDVGVPASIALPLGVFWYMFALIIVVSWWMGR